LVSGAKSGANFSFKAYCNLVKRVEVVILLHQTDKEIDAMVYKLYDLTEMEIQIVEGS